MIKQSVYFNRNTKVPFVSFVLPVWKVHFLKQAINSILSQVYTNFELVIVNDASPENVDEIIAAYKDKRIRYYKNKENIGGKNLVEQWNHCISYAKGDYIVLSSDDDVYAPEYLKECISLALKYPKVDLIHARVLQIDENDQIVGIDCLLPEITNKYEFLYWWVTGSIFICIGNYMFKKSTFLNEGGFIDYPCAFCSDVATTLLMSKNGVANTQEMLFQFRHSSIHLSGSRRLFRQKLQANNGLYTFLFSLDYSKPESSLDLFYFKQTSHIKIYEKCKYDYYNQVIRYLPFSKIYYIKDCKHISFKDKCKLIIRYCFDRIFRSNQSVRSKNS